MFQGSKRSLRAVCLTLKKLQPCIAQKTLIIAKVEEMLLTIKKKEYKTESCARLGILAIYSLYHALKIFIVKKDVVLIDIVYRAYGR